jgi:hypothetical protein
VSDRAAPGDKASGAHNRANNSGRCGCDLVQLRRQWLCDPGGARHDGASTTAVKRKADERRSREEGAREARRSTVSSHIAIRNFVV